MVDIIRAGYDQLIRAPTKTITFTGGAGAGAVGSAITAWTISGRVLLFHGTTFCTTTVVSTAGTGTISLGTSSQVAYLIAATTMGAGSLAANDWWSTDGTFAGVAVGWAQTAAVNTGQFGVNENIILTVATNAITSGVLVFDCWYLPITSGASLT